MEHLAILSIPLLFSILVYIVISKKDEKYLNALGDRLRSQQMDLKRLQIQVNSVHNKIHVVDKFCQSLKAGYAGDTRFVDEKTNPNMQTFTNSFSQELSLSKIEKELTSIKEILNLNVDDPF